jgi:hypothetical protein
MALIEYNFVVVDSQFGSLQIDTSARLKWTEIRLCARSLESLAWRKMSLRHVPLRGMGWSRNPTSFGFAPAEPESKGKASAA